MIFTIMKIILGISHRSFVGYCRYGSGDHAVMKNVLTNSSIGCHEECKANAGCVAFGYIYRAVSTNCILYRYGPYSKGNGNVNVRCYIIATGIFLRLKINKNHHVIV